MTGNSGSLPPAARRLIEWAKRKEERGGTMGVLLEGEKLVVEGLRARAKFERIWIAPNFVPRTPHLVERLQKAGCPVEETGSRVIGKISDLETPPGIVGIAHQPIFRHALPNEKWHFIVALFGAQDPGNAGAVIRSSEYFGADEVWFHTGSVDPFSPKVIRGSMGACLRLPLFRGDIMQRIKQFKTPGTVVWGAVAHGKASFSFEQASKRILMIGSESLGLSESERSMADRLIRIGRRGEGESLNLGIAAGILLYMALGEPSSEK